MGLPPSGRPGTKGGAKRRLEVDDRAFEKVRSAQKFLRERYERGTLPLSLFPAERVPTTSDVVSAAVDALLDSFHSRDEQAEILPRPRRDDSAIARVKDAGNL